MSRTDLSNVKQFKRPPVPVAERAERVADPDSGAVAFLGSTAKFQATSSPKAFNRSVTSSVDVETGEIVSLKPSGLPARDAVECRMERFALQAISALLLPSSRTAKCLRYVQKNVTGVEVWKSKQHSRSSYVGLQTCASVWACPVCSSKISERRRVELMTLVASHEAFYGIGSVVMVTRTAPHQRTDELSLLLGKFVKAESGLKAHRAYKAAAVQFGLIGTVRALEVTYGHANGFHPHVHELLFLDNVPSANRLTLLEETLYPVWAGCALRVGLDTPSRDRGIKVSKEQAKVTAYVTKWGLEAELTQWHRKQGKVESCSPFDLLRAAFNGDYQSGQLFKVFADAFQGRHQLQYSRGLKARYHVVESSDEELANRKYDASFLLGKLSLDDWRLVCKRNQRGTLLEVANLRGWEGVEDLLRDLKRVSDLMDPGRLRPR